VAFYWAETTANIESIAVMNAQFKEHLTLMDDIHFKGYKIAFRTISPAYARIIL